MQRIYAQLKPDEVGIRHLQDIQSQLPEQRSGRQLPADELHLTLIHFGRANDMYRDISATTTLSQERYDELLAQYIVKTERSLPASSITLQPVGLHGLGKHGSTLIIEYESIPQLDQSHSQVLKALTDFLHACGIPDPAAFISNNHSLLNAPRLLPHITLHKGYEGEMPSLELRPVTLSAMKVVY